MGSWFDSIWYQVLEYAQLDSGNLTDPPVRRSRQFICSFIRIRGSQGTLFTGPFEPPDSLLPQLSSSCLRYEAMILYPLCFSRVLVQVEEECCCTKFGYRSPTSSVKGARPTFRIRATVVLARNEFCTPKNHN